MGKKHDLEALATALTLAGRKLLTANALNVDEVNGILQDLGADLETAAEALRG
jgi:hypothetical protein